MSTHAAYSVSVFFIWTFYTRPHFIYILQGQKRFSNLQPKGGILLYVSHSCFLYLPILLSFLDLELKVNECYFVSSVLITDSDISEG